ncbi:type III secretion system protein [Candidatus Williamhamiltonella defendens]|uniref:Type III secretion system protein n=1 Tax=Candidatus Williamhamiltonella defendens TaxID=138072 RepID=A0A2D3T5G5_9ENTR|nr:YscQ/HrcQ family type III secretion apparatus protein [Candidatus Hamiltonella defensa]ASV32879.1 type III secretion system protein [Candidatus Hamiltonella defensa]ATW29092.1 type III secretion system protein [Candidatus Hamiltonella defensa]ATW31058.1 type III secretion system protein [Candidatus Hamiltonella defensa]AWK15832.1 type III secretion system protein [Candidatus Hamiltonella defensa]
MLLQVLPEFKALSALVGNGRKKEEVTVNMRVMEGPGIYFSVMLNELPCGLWLSEQQWSSWLESIISVASPDCLHPDLLMGISDWTLSYLPNLFPKMTLGHDIPRPTSIIKQWAVVCNYKINQQEFGFVLLNWSAHFLLETLADWHSVDKEKEFYDKNNDKLQYECGLVAGWCRLSVSQLKHIQVEDGLRLLACAELDQSCCWMWPEQGSQFYISLNEGKTVTIKDINDDIDTFLELDSDTESNDFSYKAPSDEDASDASSPDVIPEFEEEPKKISLNEFTQTLVMEIGRINIPIQDLKQLSVGKTLNCKTSFYGEVVIRLNGRKIGSGNLLSCDGELIVRIEQWLLDK